MVHFSLFQARCWHEFFSTASAIPTLDTYIHINYIRTFCFQFIHYEFDSNFGIESTSGCFADYVELSLQATTQTSPSVIKFCGGERPPAGNTKNTLRVRFRSDSSTTGPGFKLLFRVTDNGEYTRLFSSQMSTLPNQVFLGRGNKPKFKRCG